MTNFKIVDYINFLPWIRENFKINKIDTTPLQPSVAIEVRPQNLHSDSCNIPTILAEVQELTFDRNGSPNVFIVKSSQPTSEIFTEESSVDNGCWKFSSYFNSHVEDLQQNDEVTQIPDRYEKTCEQEWKPSSHLHKYLLMMHICGTAPLAKPCQLSYDHHKSWKWLYTIQKVIKKSFKIEFEFLYF